MSLRNVLSLPGCGREWWACRRNKKPVSSFYCHTLSSLVSPLFSHFVLLFVRPFPSSRLSIPLFQCLSFHYTCHFHPPPSFLHHSDWCWAPLPWLLLLYPLWLMEATRLASYTSVVTKVIDIMFVHFFFLPVSFNFLQSNKTMKTKIPKYLVPYFSDHKAHRIKIHNANELIYFHLEGTLDYKVH